MAGELNPKHEQLVRDMLRKGVVTFGEPQELRDRTSTAYVDLREAISLPGIFDDIVSAYRDTLNRNVHMVIQPSGRRRFMAGIPETALYYTGALAVQLGSQVPLLQRRVKPKEHGKPKVIEGRYEEGDEVFLVDDVITLGGTKLDEIERYKAVGLRVTGIVALVDREQGGRTELESHGIDFASAMTLRGIAQYALAEKLGGVTQTLYDEFFSELDPNEINPE